MITTIPKKYKDKSLAHLKKIARDWTHKVVRKRDEGKPCVSCGQYVILQAGHFYSAGHYDWLRYDLDNIHGQCLRCNYHLHGNLSEYRRKILTRISKQRLADLDLKAEWGKRTFTKWDRLSIILIIDKMQKKYKELTIKLQ